MGGGGGDTKTVTKSVNEPFAEQKPYLTNLYEQAVQRSRVPLGYSPWPGVAARDPNTLTGLTSTVAQGNAWSPYREGVGSMAADTFSGKFLSPDSNPYLKGTYDAAAQRVGENFNRTVMPGIASRYASAGRVGGPDEMAAYGRAQGELSDSLSDMASSIYGGAYDAERGRMTTLAQMAPALEDARFTGADRVTGVGLMQEDYAQRGWDDLTARWEFARDEPDLRLARYAGLLGNPVTGSGVQATKQSGGGGGLTQPLQAMAALASIFGR